MPDPFRVLVTGSRDWPAADRIRSELSALAGQHPEGLIVVHGDARSGADRMASDWARQERDDGRRVTGKRPIPPTGSGTAVTPASCGTRRW